MAIKGPTIPQTDISPPLSHDLVLESKLISVLDASLKIIVGTYRSMYGVAQGIRPIEDSRNIGTHYLVPTAQG